MKKLGDFAVTYERNVYRTDITAMLPMSTAMHRNIFDVFNECGVQIMTPAYEGDFEQPKVVSPKDWYTAPAAPPDATFATATADGRPLSPAPGLTVYRVDHLPCSTRTAMDPWRRTKRHAPPVHERSRPELKAIRRRVISSIPLAAILILLNVASSRAAFAQTPAAPPEPPPRLESSAQFTFLDTSGNASSQSLGTGGNFVWRPDPWMHSAKAIFAQAETDGELTARSIAGLFRSSRVLNDRLSVYGQYDFLRDVFAGVEQRHVIEGGASYLTLETLLHRLQFDAGLGYLYERNPDDHFDSVTLSLAAAYRLAISETTEFTYQPRFLLPLAKTGAWKFDQDIALTVAMNTILSLKLAHTLRHSAEPPETFERTDRILAISIVAKMRRPK